ncbi:flagellar basal-body rod protein FlgF [Stappia indica]|uniref:flagellar basal-body rod protein FlgF n=1 Tax=Stappia indica TaxID=538381 RepID=UPI001CD63AA7|nr:flagellar basal-body rod protein FlgF [Stappia indica]MCA1298825.1 flagellar basal-body rod protein FlgF [Stappia indica]
MENSLLIGLSRQTALRNQLSVVANNLANMNTTGYKAQRLMFEEYLMPVAEATSFQEQDQNYSYVLDYGASSNFDAGATSMTGNTFDVALGSEGWFAIQTPDGERYTRNGAFHLDSTGQLVTADGRPVLGEAGPLTFGTEDADITIAEDGTISSALGVRGRLKVVQFANPQTLTRIGDNLFAGNDPQPADGIRVVQGAIERSNVQGVTEVTRMIEITRNYTTVSKMMADGDELLKKAIDRLGSVQA